MAAVSTELHLLCAGAAQGLVRELQADWSAQTGAVLHARFGAVGAMKEALLGGEPCDLLIVTDAMVADLAIGGVLVPDSRAVLGRVRTGVAVQAGAAVPDVSSPAALKAALRAARGIYFPDPVRATAGIHFARLLRDLGIHDELAPRFRTYPNGATSMRELAACAEPGLIGCTQVSEILYTDGTALAGVLPAPFELATVYTAAVSARAAQPALAAHLAALLSGETSLALRAAGGFEA